VLETVFKAGMALVQVLKLTELDRLVPQHFAHDAETVFGFVQGDATVAQVTLGMAFDEFFVQIPGRSSYLGWATNPAKSGSRAQSTASKALSPADRSLQPAPRSFSWTGQLPPRPAGHIFPSF